MLHTDRISSVRPNNLKVLFLTDGNCMTHILTKCRFINIDVEGFLKIDTICFELSHNIESSLRSLSTM